MWEIFGALHEQDWKEKDIWKRYSKNQSVESTKKRKHGKEIIGQVMIQDFVRRDPLSPKVRIIEILFGWRGQVTSNNYFEDDKKDFSYNGRGWIISDYGSYNGEVQKS